MPESEIATCLAEHDPFQRATCRWHTCGMSFDRRDSFIDLEGALRTWTGPVLDDELLPVSPIVVELSESVIGSFRGREDTSCGVQQIGNHACTLSVLNLASIFHDYAGYFTNIAIPIHHYPEFDGPLWAWWQGNSPSTGLIEGQIQRGERGGLQVDIPLIVARAPIKDRVTIWTEVIVSGVAVITSGAYPIYGGSAQDEASSDRNPI